MVQIVILDDRETNRKIFSKLAGSIEPGVTVHSFGNPVELLAWLEHNTPDLVVTDFKMPSMDGAQTAGMIRDLHPAARIVAFSGVLDEKPEWADDLYIKGDLPDLELVIDLTRH